VTRSDREAYIRQALAEAAEALRMCSTGLRGMRVAHGELEPVTRAMWPDWERDEDERWYAEWHGLLPGTRTRIQATNAQLSKLDKVLPWFYAIKDQRWRRAVYLRAAWTKPDGRAAGWRRIGLMLGVSHVTARQWEKQGIEEINKSLYRQPGPVPSWRDDCQGG
jgi:hypothetical protein